MINDNLKQIQNQIDKAIARRIEQKITGDKVTVVAVSKTQTPEAVIEALSNGLNILGENKVQEAQAKMPQVNAGSWNLIGHLQTNKVKKAVSLFDMIYSVDSEKLLIEIDRHAKEQNKVQNILLQINVAKEASKTGFTVEEFLDKAHGFCNCQNICLRGLMIIAPEYDNLEDTRVVFKKGYELFCYMKENVKSQVDTLSMGMSTDFTIAIEEGSNNIRLGTILFGARNYAK